MRIVIDIDTGETASRIATPTSAVTSSPDIDAGPAAVGESAPTVTVDKGVSATDSISAAEDVDAGAAGTNANNQPTPADERGVDGGPAPEF
jgi:hypothetical protein